MGHDVFISHSSRDKAVADGVCATLERNGLRCWIAPRDVLPGTDWSASIVAAIRGSRAFVLVFSQAANDSPQIRREVERAMHHGVPIIPYRIEHVAPTEALEYAISNQHWLDAFTPPVEQHAQALADSLNRLLNAAPIAPSPPPAPSASQPAAPPNRRPATVALAVGGVVAAIGLLAYFVVQPPKPAPGPGPTPPANATTSFVGDWKVGKVAWAAGTPAGYGKTTLGELFAAVMSANRTGGAFSLGPAGGFKTVVTLDDTGTVTAANGGYVFSSTSGATAPVAARRLSAVNLGGGVAEAGLALIGVDGRLPESWVGSQDPAASGGPLAAIAGDWRNGAWPVLPGDQVWTATLRVQPNGVYALHLSQSVGGVFKADGGKWSVSMTAPGAPAPLDDGGDYVFHGPDTVEVSSLQGTTTWVRAK